jgi:hypothetical protein
VLANDRLVTVASIAIGLALFFVARSFDARKRARRDASSDGDSGVWNEFKSDDSHHHGHSGHDGGGWGGDSGGDSGGGHH